MGGGGSPRCKYPGAFVTSSVQLVRRTNAACTTSITKRSTSIGSEDGTSMPDTKEERNFSSVGRYAVTAADDMPRQKIKIGVRRQAKIENRS
jgi:hypothetical protein